jgi:hypothetical protein
MQRRQERLGQRDVAEEVDLEQPTPFVDRQGLDRRIDGDGCIVDDGA